MQSRVVVPLMAAGVFAGLALSVQPAPTVSADGGDSSYATVDSDGDFLPDCVEWLTLTDPHNPDTDGDTIPDFVEVVEAGRPRHESLPLPEDHDMRLMITGPAPGSNDPRTWLHVFYRVFAPPGSPAVNSVQSFEVWLENPAWGSVALPLSTLAAGEVVYREMSTPSRGIWVQLSVPFVSEQILQMLMPCTLWARSTVRDRVLRSGFKLLQVPSGPVAIVPFGDGRFVMQTLQPVPPLVPMPSMSNRVCVLELTEQSVGPAGTTYEVCGADCEDANELECTVDCQNSIGWTITIPGGTEMIGGN